MGNLENINWLVSLLAAIPLSIAANLLTPYIRDWFAKRSSKKAQKRIKEIEFEQGIVARYAESKEDLSLFLLGTILRVLVLFSLASGIALMGFLPNVTPLVPGALYGAGGMISALAYLLGITRGVSALGTLRKVENFNEYNAEVESLKSTLKQVASKQ
jgi:O-antigen/teichoic acid export membrane protein